MRLHPSKQCDSCKQTTGSANIDNKFTFIAFYRTILEIPLLIDQMQFQLIICKQIVR